MPSGSAKVAARVGLVLTLLAAVACQGDAERPVGADVPGSLTVRSGAFADGTTIPRRFTCDGAGVSPPLSWTGVGPGAEGLALLVDDPDAPGGTYTHWVVVGIRPTATGVPADRVPGGAGQVPNSSGDVSYAPPCPPEGTHHYRFTVYALDRRLHLDEGTGLDEAAEAIADHATARGRLVGTVSAG